MHVDDVGLRVEMIVPDIFEQHGAGHHLPGMAHQIFEQAEFARLQRDVASGAAHRMRQPVEFQIAGAVDRLGLARTGAAAQHLDAGEQFREGVGLGQVVVAAGAQAGDAVVDLAERRQDQHRRGIAARAQRGNQRKPVAARQHAVDDHDVVFARIGERETGLSVACHVDIVAGLGKGLLKIFGSLAVVFDNQNLHGTTYTSKMPAARYQLRRTRRHSAAAGDGNLPPPDPPTDD